MRNSPLLSLSLTKYHLNDKIVTMMANVWKIDHTKIPLELCLSENFIGDDGAKSLAEMLLVMELPMKCLDLSENHIGVGGMSAILKVFNVHPKKSQNFFSLLRTNLFIQNGVTLEVQCQEGQIQSWHMTCQSITPVRDLINH